MTKFLHSLPWTVALALAQAGEEPPASRLQALEDTFNVSVALHAGGVEGSEAAAAAPLALNADEEREQAG